MQVVDRNGRLKVEITNAVDELTVGVTNIVGGVSGRALYDNAGVLGELDLASTYVPLSRTLTINGTTQDLSANRTFTVSTGITIGTTAITSGTVGRVLFEGTGNVVQESANLFWDNTNGRLGVGTSSPARALDIVKTIASGAIEGIKIEVNHSSSTSAAILDFVHTQFDARCRIQSIAGAGGANPTLSFIIRSLTAMNIFQSGNIGINTTTDAGFKLDVNGTARVQGSLTISASGSLLMNNNNIYIARGTGTATDGMEIRALSSGTDAVKVTTSCVSISSAGGLTYQASAQLAVDSTTRGFLCPRMTTTQKNAIASPATGLMVYDTTLNLISVYNGTIWITL